MSVEAAQRSRVLAKQLRIVAADDNPKILEIITELLGDEFSIVGLFRDGQSILKHTAAIAPDIIILDVSLGDCSGFDVARSLRRDGTTAEILFLTICEGEDFVKAAFEAGGSAYVTKHRLASDLLPALHAVANHEVFVSNYSN